MPFASEIDTPSCALSARIRTALRGLWTRSAADICHGLLEEVRRRAGGTLPDDATVVVLKFD